MAGRGMLRAIAGGLREWSRADAEFSPTYENRANYRQIVDQTIAGMKRP